MPAIIHIFYDKTLSNSDIHIKQICEKGGLLIDN